MTAGLRHSSPILQLQPHQLSEHRGRAVEVLMLRHPPLPVVPEDRNKVRRGHSSSAATDQRDENLAARA